MFTKWTRETIQGFRVMVFSATSFSTISWYIDYPKGTDTYIKAKGCHMSIWLPILFRKDMNVNEHERLSYFTLKHKLM